MIFVTRLKFFFDSNFYKKFRPDYSNFEYVKRNTSINKSYEIKNIVTKRIRKYNKTAVTKYMIK